MSRSVRIKKQSATYLPLWFWKMIFALHFLTYALQKWTGHAGHKPPFPIFLQIRKWFWIRYWTYAIKTNCYMVDSKYLTSFLMKNSDYQCEFGMSPKKQQPREWEAPLPLLERNQIQSLRSIWRAKIRAYAIFSVDCEWLYVPED